MHYFDKKKIFPWLLLSVGIVIIDQWSKYLITTELHLHQIIELLPVFNLTLAYNRGAAFSFLASASGWQRWFFIILTLSVSVILILWLYRVRRSIIWERLGIALILGGAWGNLIDRVLLGHVVDFIQVHWQNWYFPAFNVADSAITIGAGLLILDNLFTAPSRDI